MSTNGIRNSKSHMTKGGGHAVGTEGGRSKQGSRGKVKQGSSRKVTVVTREVLESEREDLISQKQKQLQTVVEHHDTLVCFLSSPLTCTSSHRNSKVREMFHMDHFINMVGFDPKVRSIMYLVMDAH